MVTEAAPDTDALVAPGDGWWSLAVFGGALFVAVAIGLEVVGGSYANSPTPSWSHWMPIAWPVAARVAWWMLVATAAAAFRLGLHRLGFRQRAFVVVLTVGPFVAFSVGIATGADWSTWH